jgi:pyrroloquinoline quinone biosynthesis protein D
MNSVDLNNRPALASYARLRTDPLTGEAVLLFPEGVLVLNSTAYSIILLCDGQTSGREILTALSADYAVDEDLLQADVTECLADLCRRNLVVLKP